MSTGQAADESVTVCGPQVAPEEVVKPRPRPPVVKGVDVLPATGAQVGIGWLVTGGGLAVVLGAWMLVGARRREQQTR